MLIENVDYFVRLIDLPPSIGGFVRPNNDGTFSVYLNSRLPWETNIVSCDHEKRHIEHNDFYRQIPLAQKEAEAG